jgi:pyruvate formate lyase activating enzyme
LQLRVRAVDVRAAIERPELRMQSGLIFNVQRFSLHDGPGIRTTVFLKGCALSCSWCHNPESQSTRPEVMVNEERCIRCGSCVAACATGVPAPGDGRGAEDLSLCTVCGACVDACPTEARQLAGREIDVATLVEEIARDRIFFDQSGGGVTFSGGEPLHQAEFLKAALTECRAAGLHSAVDTCGLATRDELLAMAELADLVLYDLKLADDLRHREHTGVGNEAILGNLRALAESHPAIWLRVPLIPGINDDRENLDGIAELAASLPAVERICLLPYHRTGEGKQERLGLHTGPLKTTPPSTEQVEQAAARFEAHGLTLQIGG